MVVTKSSAIIQEDERLLGMPTIGRPATTTLYVSQNGDNTDGSSWSHAYNTLNAALDAASTDAQDDTAILLAPGTYDINVTGDPTWSANVEIHGAHRRWSTITNSHASATSILKLTGKASLEDLSFPQTGACNGVIMTASAFRIRRCGFNSSACTGAVKSIHIDGTAGTLVGGRIEDVRVVGHVSYTTGLYLDTVSFSDFDVIDTHFCLNGIQIVNVASDNNFFNNIDLGGCAIGLNLDAGNSQHFTDVNFHENTLNVDDEVGDHHWHNIHGQFPITTEPDNFTGVAVDTGDGVDTWTTVPVEVRAAATATKPFIIVGINFDAGTNEKYRFRLSADNGSTWFDDFQIEDARNTTLAFSSGTEFIFNAGTAITAQSKSESEGIDGLDVWLKIQEI